MFSSCFSCIVVFSVAIVTVYHMPLAQQLAVKRLPYLSPYMMAEGMWLHTFCFVFFICPMEAVLATTRCDGCHEPVRSNQLLQMHSASVHGATSGSPIFHFEEEKMWGLDQNMSWHLVWTNHSCMLSFPASPKNSTPVTSPFSLGICLRPWKPLERWRLDLELPASQGRTHPGTNPAFVSLPLVLQTAFPSGKWLVVSRFGWARCPGMEDFVHAPEFEYMRSLQ